jgi:4-alpha-glucanotransferase
MNIPGLGDGNWTWRMTEDQMNGCDPAWLRGLGETYGRVPGLNVSW